MCSKLLVAFCLLAPFALSVLAQMDMAEPMEEEEDMMMGFDDMDRQDDDEWIHFRADGTGAPPAGGGQATTGAPCSPTGKCFGDRDCGAKGRCIGFGAGTCDCSQCLQASLCNLGEVVGQRSCGGLEGACNQTSNVCNCEAGYKQAGFASFGDAVLKFCNKQECDGQSNSCFGLPCKAGFCMCL